MHGAGASGDLGNRADPFVRYRARGCPTMNVLDDNNPLLSLDVRRVGRKRYTRLRLYPTGPNPALHKCETPELTEWRRI